MITILEDHVRPPTSKVLNLGANVCVKSNADDVINKFFLENGLGELEFTSKTWLRLKAVANKLNIPELLNHFGNTAKISYSHKVGFFFGAAPGYKIRALKKKSPYVNHDLWVSITVDTKTLRDSLPKFKLSLDAERASK